MEIKKNKKKKTYVMPQDQLTQTTGWLGTIFLVTVAALFILVGSVMLFVDGIKEPNVFTYKVEDDDRLIGARRLLTLYRKNKIASIKNNSFYEFLQYGYSQNRCFIEYIDHTNKGNGALVRVEYHIIIDIGRSSSKQI